MKYFRLIVKNLLRNKRRSLLTLTSITISLFLVATLTTILTELQNPIETPDSALRLIARHRISLFNTLPKAHQPKIAQLDGVDAVVGSMWFGGYYRDPANFFANFAADTEDFFRVHPDYLTPPDQQEAYKNDRTGALAGSNLASRFGWKVGDIITLTGTLFNLTPELTIRALYDEGPDDGNTLFFHWDYFNEAFGNNNFTGTYTIRVASKELVPVISEKVDELFQNSMSPTKTETERAFILGFVEMLGDIQLFITSIISVVTFTILLVAGNTMAMSIRERVREIGIMKALGFRSSHVLGLLIGESILLTLSGALLGSFAARLIFSGIDMSQISMGFLARFYVTNGTLVFCAAIGTMIGILSAAIPAYQTSRRSVIDALGRP